jgi:hypothetical protein
MLDRWLAQAAPRRPSTWAQQKRQFRALRVPAKVYDKLQRWVASPVELEPLFWLIIDIVFSNAVHRARRKAGRWAAGAARDPHHKQTPEVPGALRPILDLVDGVIGDLERLITWEFTPPIELHELDATLKPTRRTIRLSRLDEGIRAAFETARSALLPVRENLRTATQRDRGRKPTLVQPGTVSALRMPTGSPPPARRRELERLLRDQILLLHPQRTIRPRAASGEAGRMAGRILDSIPL